MNTRSFLPLALPSVLLSAVALQLGSPWREAPPPLLRTNRPPVLSASVSGTSEVLVQQRVQFTVRAVDPDGDAVTVRLLNPLPGLVFDPAQGDPSPFAGAVDWCVSRAAGGFQVLRFEATDGRSPAVRLDLSFVVVGQMGPFQAAKPPNYGFLQHYPAPLQTADVTGDGVLDVIGVASAADVGGVTDAGALYVWAGGAGLSTAPSATLTVPGAAAGDRLGVVTMRLVDVTGDGVLDVLAAAPLADVAGTVDAGAIYLWIGGGALVGPRPPDGILSVPLAAENDVLTFCQGQGLSFADVTGDGLMDVVAAASEADGSVVNEGALYVWRGRTGAWGSVEPTATLRSASPAAGDRLANGLLESVLLGDVTGDGVPDVVSISRTVDDGGSVDTGAVFVWEGGPSLTGLRTPYALLRVSGAASGDRLGQTDWTQLGFRLVDLTGDGVLDVLAGSSLADVGGTVDAGAFYLWKGGSELASGDPTATLTVPGAESGLRLGYSIVRTLADVTGDGLADLVVGSYQADYQGAADVGLVFVWEASDALSGIVAPTATLVPVPANPGLLTTYAAATSSSTIGLQNETIHFADVTGDGQLDVIAVSSERGYLTSPGNQIGLIFVWAGGPALRGTLGATATLSVPGARPRDQLGRAPRGVQAVDLTGDGILDLVAGSDTAARTASSQDDGAIYLFEGGPGMIGAVAPRATLRDPNSVSGDSMTGTRIDPSIRFGDVTGDGTLDVVTLSIDRGGVPGAPSATGALFVFAGDDGFQGTMAPTAILSDPSSRRMSWWYYQTPFQLADVNDDGVLDVLAGSTAAVVGGVGSAGAAYVWSGGPELAGSRPADVLVARAAPQPGDTLGRATGEGLLVADVSGDGVLDLVLAAYQADVGGVSDTGLILVTPGPLLPSAVPVELSVPGASTGDALGL